MKKLYAVFFAASLMLGLSGTQAGAVITEHQNIASYDGPSTCIACHATEAQDMLNSLHMNWSGPTTELTNTNGEDLGKQEGGINTFCTYAVSSQVACYGCHVRADGNAPHAPSANDVDCLMCHQDTYQRKFLSDPTDTETVVNVLGETKTYVYALKDPATGDYFTEPDFGKMPAGTTMVDLARTVHRPTRASCLRCHAKAGGGDWTKRGDMGLSTKNPTVAEDVHMSPDAGGANLTCTSCHTAVNHKIGGRGIDLRQTEAADPKCTNCHTGSIHMNSEYDRHAQGQVSCQVCHIRTFGKGGATEMSRDWLQPHWNPGFCAGQGGFVGHEVKVANVTPEYRWFDGTSYVYNVGETIEANADGTYTMAKANGAAFDGNSQIVPIKNHWTVMPLHESGVIIPPQINWQFMTGYFDIAVQKGMENEGLTGNYTIVDANAEMLITHGVDPKSNAPACTECHDYSGETPDGTKMIPFTELGYHTWPAKVKSCTLCHEQKSKSWQEMHRKHAEEMGKNCKGCHTSEPTGWIEPPTPSGLCNNCHSGRSYSDPQDLHKEHAESDHGTMHTTCTDCHTFGGSGGGNPPPPPASCSDYTEEAPCDADPDCYWSNYRNECRDNN